MNWCWRIMNWLRHDLLAWIELQPMCRKAQFMPKAIHENGFQFTQPRGCNSLRDVLNGQHAYEWIDADASWIGSAMISRRRFASSMNWIATNIMPARAIHAVYCNSWYAVSIHATPLQFIAVVLNGGHAPARKEKDKGRGRDYRDRIRIRIGLGKNNNN